MSVDELFAAVDERQEATTPRRHVTEEQLVRARTTPPPRDPISDPPRPARPAAWAGAPEHAMRKSRIRELRRARPIAWQNAIRRAAFEPCWRTSADGWAWQRRLTQIMGEGLPPEAPQS